MFSVRRFFNKMICSELSYMVRYVLSYMPIANPIRGVG